MFSFVEVEADYLIIECAGFQKNILYFPETDGWFTESHKDFLEKYIEKGLSMKAMR